MTLYETILNISTAENNLRKDENLITNDMTYPVSTARLRYVKGIPTSKLVLTGTQNRETISNHEFNMEFSKKTHDLLTYVSWNNLVVAGGALVNIITKSDAKLNDVDLFVYGLNKKDTTEKIDQVISHIKQKAADMNYETRAYMNKNVINLYVFDTKKLLQIQIILRLYDSLTKILMGFDVDCCAVAFNGSNILTTVRGEYALKHRVNVANLQRRSPSYENRLIKYSFRGFDVVTDFPYEKQYNKLFFMAPENVGFTRLLEQELINNGQLKNISFGNTLRFRKTASYTKGGSWYQKDNLEITNITHTENCITKYNANIDDDSMKFREYSVKYIEMMENNVMDQLTGSFHPITEQHWISVNCGDNDRDPLGRSKEFLDLKYNRYESVAQFDNVTISDMSNLDTKCLAVIYVDNDEDVVRIIDSKYVYKSTNMYKINYVQLAILLGRTKLAMRLMKGHRYETYKELIYMMDNDKLFTNYCHENGKSCTDIDKELVAKFGCVNISDNIHNQKEVNDKLTILYDQTVTEQLITLGLSSNLSEYGTVDITKLSYSAIKLLYECGVFAETQLYKYISKTCDWDEIQKIKDHLDHDEASILQFSIDCFLKTEAHRDKNTSDNVKKLLKVKGLWDDDLECVNIYKECDKINGNLHMCMKLIRNEQFDMETIKKLIGTGKSYDIMIGYAVYLDDVNLIKKLIPEDELYVKLKYHYVASDGSNVKRFFDEIDKKRQEDKKKINEYLKNTSYHVDALNDGDLPEGYDRNENVFGMTPDDNIVAKLLLMYNKVFNKRVALNDKDKTTLHTMRKAVMNIRRNNEFNRVDTSYFYSLDLHELFFVSKNDDKKTNNVEDVNIDDFDNFDNTETVKQHPKDQPKPAITKTELLNKMIYRDAKKKESVKTDGPNKTPNRYVKNAQEKEAVKTEGGKKSRDRYVKKAEETDESDFSSDIESGSKVPLSDGSW